MEISFPRSGVDREQGQRTGAGAGVADLSRDPGETETAVSVKSKQLQLTFLADGETDTIEVVLIQNFQFGIRLVGLAFHGSYFTLLVLSENDANLRLGSTVVNCFPPCS